MNFLSMIKNVEYQLTAVETACSFVMESLNKERATPRQFIIAPTGSGKTVMAAAVIEYLSQRNIQQSLKKKIRFVFVTHSKVMAQDFSEKFKVLNTSVSTIEDIENKVYTKTTVLLTNPEKFSVVAKQGKEFLEKWLGKKEDEYIVLIMDEGDITHDGKRNTLIKDLVEPDLELCFSATFDEKKDYKKAIKNNREKSEVLHRVPIQEVIDSGMIVKCHEYLVNVNNVTFDSIMKMAVDKQIELENIIKNLPSEQHFVPKILIQAQSGEISDIIQKLASLLKNHYKIVLDPEMYCIINQDIDEQDIKDKAKIKFYLGDQLVGRGWDSPQTYIVVSFKKSSDMSVGVQLLGRVSRMPFQKHFDKNMDSLNKGYVYVNGDHSVVKAVNSYLDSQSNSNEKESAPIKPVIVSAIKENIKIPSIKTYIKQEASPASEEVIEGLYSYLKDTFNKVIKDNAIEHKIGKKEIDSSTGSVKHISNENVEIEIYAALNHLKSVLVAKGFPDDVANDSLSVFIQDKDCKNDWKHYHKLIGASIIEDSSDKVIKLLIAIDFKNEAFKFVGKNVAESWNKTWDRSLYEFEEMGSKEESLADYLDSFCKKNNLYWTKNVENKQVRLSLGYYPDFILFNENKYVFLEYKGAHLKGNANTILKIEFGEKHDPRVFMVESKGDNFIVRNSKNEELSLEKLETDLFSILV